MRPSQLLVAVAALSSVTAAWSDVFDSTHALDEVKNVLYGRQDGSSTTDASPSPTAAESTKETNSPSTTEKPSSTPASNEDSKTTDKSSTTGSGSGSPTGTARGSATKSSGKPKATNYGADVPAGTVAMVTPGVFAGTQYYKIGDWVHLAWNYTSLSAPPAAVDVMATCTQNQATYTIAVNQSVQSTGEVFWNTGDYQNEHPNSPPLLMAMYTLLIYDSNLTASATAKPGHLAVYNQHTFGMYEKQPYVDWEKGYTCPTCNGALSALDALTLKAMVITSATTITSLLYFSYSFGMW